MQRVGSRLSGFSLGKAFAELHEHVLNLRIGLRAGLHKHRSNFLRVRPSDGGLYLLMHKGQNESTFGTGILDMTCEALIARAEERYVVFAQVSRFAEHGLVW